MESENVSKSELKKDSFFRYVFNFDDDSKAEFSNAMQYSLLSVIPVILLNKSVNKIIPDVDEEKGSIELLAEVCGQIIFMFVGFIFIDRIVSFVPTYSEVDYKPFHVTNIAIIFLVIVLSLQSKIGEKTNILLDRFLDLVQGETSLKKNDKKPQHTPSQQGGHQPSRADIGNNPPQVQQQTHNQNFNNMYAGPQNHLVNANTPGQPPVNEPMAANALGGAFGSLF
jgi:hypothetical protein